MYIFGVLYLSQVLPAYKLQRHITKSASLCPLKYLWYTCESIEGEFQYKATLYLYCENDIFLQSENLLKSR